MQLAYCHFALALVSSLPAFLGLGRAPLGGTGTQGAGVGVLCWSLLPAHQNTLQALINLSFSELGADQVQQSLLQV